MILYGYVCILNKSLRKIIGSTYLIGIILFNYSVAADNDFKKPNILLVLMDNFGYGEIGVYGGGVLRGAPNPKMHDHGLLGHGNANPHLQHNNRNLIYVHQ